MDRIKSFNELLELARKEQPPKVDMALRIMNSINEQEIEEEDTTIKLWFAGLCGAAAAAAVAVILTLGGNNSSADITNLFTDIDPSYGLSVLWGA